MKKNYTIGFVVLRELPYATIGQCLPCCDAYGVSVPTAVVKKKTKQRTSYWIYHIPKEVALQTPSYFEPIWGTVTEDINDLQVLNRENLTKHRDTGMIFRKE